MNEHAFDDVAMVAEQSPRTTRGVAVIADHSPSAEVRSANGALVLLLGDQRCNGLVVETRAPHPASLDAPSHVIGIALCALAAALLRAWLVLRLQVIWRASGNGIRAGGQRLARRLGFVLGGVRASFRQVIGPFFRGDVGFQYFGHAV